MSLNVNLQYGQGSQPWNFEGSWNSFAGHKWKVKIESWLDNMLSTKCYLITIIFMWDLLLNKLKLNGELWGFEVSWSPIFCYGNFTLEFEGLKFLNGWNYVSWFSWSSFSLSISKPIRALEGNPSILTMPLHLHEINSFLVELLWHYLKHHYEMLDHQWHATFNDNALIRKTFLLQNWQAHALTYIEFAHLSILWCALH